MLILLNKTMKQQTRAYLLALATVLLWSTSASAFKLSLNHTDNVHLLFYSSFTATILIVVINLIRRADFRRFYRTKKDIQYTILLGFLNPFLYYIILFKAFQLLPAQQAQPLNFIWPLTIVLFSNLILKQKLRITTITALLISFLGVVVISTKGSFNFGSLDNPLGVFLALFSSIIWGLFFVLNLKDKRDGLMKLQYTFAMGTFFSLIYLVITRNPIFDTFFGLLGGIYIGTFEMALAFFFWSEALRLSTHSAQVSNLIFLTPFISLICINFIVGEHVQPSALIGLGIIILGILSQRFSEMLYKK